MEVTGIVLMEAFFKGLIMVMMLVGNVLVMAAWWTNDALKRRKSSWLVINLAVTDLLLGIFVIPVAVISDVNDSFVWNNKLFCQLWKASDVFLSVASLWSIIILSVDRYIFITRPLKYEEIMSGKKMGTMIGLVWVGAFCYSYPWFLFELAEPMEVVNFLLQYNICVIISKTVWAVASIIHSFLIPFGCIFAANLRIFWIVRTQVKKINSELSSSEQAQLKSTTRAAKSLALIVVMFVLLWFPFFVIMNIDTACGFCMPPIAFEIGTWMGYANSAVNPILYAYDKAFKKAYMKLFRCKGNVVIGIYD